MKKSTSKFLSFIIIILFLFSIMPPQIAHAETSGGYTYTVSDGKATITRYEAVELNAIIPETLGGYPVTGIDEGAFSFNTFLTSVTIPKSVISIGYGAFYDCSELTAINVSSENTVYSSLNGVVYNKDQTTLVCYPSGKSGAFEIPSSVTSIGIKAFYNCIGLTSVTIPNSVTSIGSEAFRSCSNLTSVTMGSGVTSIGNSAFFDCWNLTSVTMGNNVTSIGSGAFESCSNLTSIAIPDSVTSIGALAFYECSNLGSINVSSGNTIYSSLEGVLYDKAQTTLIRYPSSKPGSFEIPNSVTSIAPNAFEGCRELTSVTIGSNVTSIADGAFLGCFNIETIYANPKTAPTASNAAFGEALGAVLFKPDGAVGYDQEPWSLFRKPVTSIAITKFPKAEYIVGQSLDIAGLEVTATYYDGTTKEVPVSIDNISGFDSSAPVTGQVVTVTYEGKTTTFTVNIAPKALESIKIITPPEKIEYVVGQSLDLTGLVVFGTYNNGSQDVVPISMDNVSGFNSSVPVIGQVVTVTAEGKTATFTVNIVPKAIASIAITKSPTKTRYIAGESFDPAGMVVTATYNDESKTSVTGYTINPSGALAAGVTKVTISYDGKTAYQPITVEPKTVTSIAITKSPDKKDYVAGQSFDPKGMIVTATYYDGTKAAVTGYTINPSGALAAGVTKVTISYGGKTAEQLITVAAKTVTSIAITTPPTKTSYIAGQSFDPKGMVVTATYNDGTKAAVTGYTISPSGALTAGLTKVTISYGGKTAEQLITVAAKTVSSIAITKSPTKTSYIAGQSFGPTGMVVTATYNDGTKAAVTGYTISPSGALTAGLTKVTISYGGKTAEQLITVAAKTVTSIVITAPPKKTTYGVGQSFDPAGMVVTATYNDGTKAAVTGYTINPSGALAAGVTKVTVSYGGRTVEQAITVLAKIMTGITITTPPTKTTYGIGQSLDLTGLVVTGTYSDGTKAVVPITASNISGFNSSTPVTGQVVKVTVGGLTATFKVNIVKFVDVLAGADRFSTAVEISKASYSTANTVILAIGYDFPDALAAGPLAIQENAPILLTAVNSLPKATRDELIRLKAKRVIIMGGDKAVGPEVVSALKSLGITVERVNGNDRFSTAVEAAKRVRAKSGVTDKIVLANGFGFADALSIGSYASKESIPILLTKADFLPEATKAAIKAFGIKEVQIIGGTSVVSLSVERELLSMGIKVTRSSGIDRFGTSLDIAGKYFQESQKAIVVNGFGFADALAAVPLAAKLNAPIILVKQNALPSEVSTYISKSKIDFITVAGGDVAVGQTVKNQLINLLK